MAGKPKYMISPQQLAIPEDWYLERFQVDVIDLARVYANDPDFFSTLRQTAKKLYEETDYAITANYGSLFFELSQWIFRNDEFFIRLITEKEMMEKMLDKLTEIHLERLEPFIEAVDPYAQVIIFGDDLGTQNNSMISPDMYREIFFPRHKEVFEFVKRKRS
jgi:uroporphyrinogen decarboxylase